jgi:Protein of unknown function (DUF5672)
MKLELLDVTLVCIETRQHRLALMAVQDCLRQVKFGETIIFSDKPEFFASQLNGEHGLRTVEVPDWSQKEGWSQFFWNGVAPYLRTAYMLSIQWDAGIVDPEMWDDEFFRYDVIGAPWTWYNDNRRVGNGGFTLRSTRLTRYLRANRDRFPCTTSLDDDLLNRKFRPQLEEIGFVWAPEPVATRFAFECERPAHSTFGWHALYNWGYVFDHEQLIERCKIAMQSPYITKNSWMFDQLLKRNPGLEEELKVP